MLMEICFETTPKMSILQPGQKEPWRYRERIFGKESACGVNPGQQRHGCLTEELLYIHIQGKSFYPAG